VKQIYSAIDGIVIVVNTAPALPSEDKAAGRTGLQSYRSGTSYPDAATTGSIFVGALSAFFDQDR
jgi:hypothetical protein